MTIRLAVTMGDVAGIGGEVILKALGKLTIPSDVQITIIGSKACLRKTYTHLQSIIDAPLANPDCLEVLDIDCPYDFIWGEGSKATGRASFLYLKEAIELTRKGEFDGIVTAPIAKYWWQEAGINYPGQTEVLGEMAGVGKYGMMFVAKSPYTGWILRTLLATTHIPLKMVADTLTPQLMDEKLSLLVESLEKDFNVSNPHIAVAGLNPHSGEDGKIGWEEKQWLSDWLEKAKAQYPHVVFSGLIPPDTMWVKPTQAWFLDGSIATPSAFLALYHDQGLIPVKAMAFFEAVNTTIGLPFVRTSPDHGTAFDIAGKGIAEAKSMIAAIEWALELCRNRKKLQVKGG
ncbi:MAG: 4-hydroxythreonine-4-phosphate dehydrogenase PdxA [Geminocystis sp.]|nr:4-hydroxythreonine-4-phosphate dehydrogenase PdxA [Geminocystis sp.]HIK38410.1 4-hydroxythreonine-4-phosphate dehydrogenase PdxA [Geminocystis sp. M7585_C2015_104]MCS7147755.1 4-hydroxythreonine-4-phosphate dehydrogenase PdxA [Geminocystis sp.]MCX8079225.1 4-hydroxythreonine-4-phosphate dehydrogenase PdxA [Geminocystis sp.]MDW8116671.1 4-hydroxythreonine-4-phosphate dehydrogenase PdxA [Geminocystis sp.]